MLRAALRTGRCRIVPEAYVTDIVRDRSGRRATGVRYLDLTGDPADGPPASIEIRARHVVLAGGAFETPRLLLSTDAGNSSGQVGRNLMFHFQTLVVGGYRERMFGATRGRAVTHLHDDHIVGDERPDEGGGGRRPAVAAGRDRRARRRRRPGVRVPDLRPRRAPRRGDARLGRCGSGLLVFTMQGEDLAQPIQPGRPRPVGDRRLGSPRRPGDLLLAPSRAGHARPTSGRCSRTC